MQTPVAMLHTRVVTQYILVREVRCDLVKRQIELARCFRKIDGAACLTRQPFHATLRCERAQVGALVQSGLDHVDLGIVSQHALHDKIEILLLAGRFNSV
jgi:hypothetical protein